MRRLRATGALLLLLTLLIGVPAALAGTIGNPLAALPDLRAGDLTDTALIGLLAAVAWVAWAQFAVATALEVVSALRQTPMPRQIPGIPGGQQQLARALVTAVFLLGPVTAGTLLTPGMLANLPAPASPVGSSQPLATAQHTAQRTTQPADHPAAPSTAPAAAHQVTGRRATGAGAPAPVVYTIPTGPGPATLWDIAVVHLGAGERWREIWQLSQGRRQPGGTTMSSPRRLLPGWTVLLPAIAIPTRPMPHPAAPTPPAPTPPVPVSGAEPTVAAEVTVRPGDTLSELAAAHGHPDWQPAWLANAGRAEPDGSRYTDPDLIRPGWRLTIPATATAVAGIAPAPAQPKAGVAAAPALPGLAKATGLAKPTRPAPAPSAGRAVSAGPDRGVPVEAGVPATAGNGQPSKAAARNDSGAAARPSADREDNARAPLPVEMIGFAGGGVLLASVSLVALRRLRRRRFRERILGQTISVTPAALAPMEKALLARGPVGAADVTWLDTALRSLVQAVAAGPVGGRFPDVVAVRMTPEVLELVLTAPQSKAPAPWQVDLSGLRWSVLRGDDLGIHPGDARQQSAPYPTLATVGYTDTGEHWLLDLERLGAISLVGDPVRCADLARFLAAELAHNSWSEQLQVSLVGFGAELAGLNPSRMTCHSDTGAVVTSLHTALQDTTAVLEQSGTDVLTGRLRHDAPGDGWPPHVLFVNGNSTDRDTNDEVDASGLPALLQVMRAQRCRTATAVVLATGSRHETDSRWQLHIDSAGQLTIPALDLQLIAQQLPAEEAADLAALLALTADGNDIALPPARGDQPWDSFADAAGAPLPTITGDRLEGDDDDHADGGPSSVLPMATMTYLAGTATTRRDVDVLAPAVTAQVRRQIQDADPGLDADLTAWHDPNARGARLTLLGAVTLTAPGTVPAKRRGYHTEIVAYLLSRPRGVTTEQIAADFWPEEAGTPQVAGRVRNAMSTARMWLGKDPVTGADLLPLANVGVNGVGLYRVRGVLVDAELFRRLRLRGVARGPGGIADLQAALDLVTGAPLGQRRPGGYGWLVDTPLDHEYTAMIIDTAHLVATHHLADGAPELAEQAAHAALRAGARDDIALLDLVAASDAAGNHGAADSYIARILANHEADVEEDLPPRTYEVLRRRRWLPQDRNPARAS